LIAAWLAQQMLQITGKETRWFCLLRKKGLKDKYSGSMVVKEVGEL